MARSIVLRFDAQCVDCGRSLSAGTTARWFGRGRVSCCGGQAPSSVAPQARPSSVPPLPPSSSVNPLPAHSVPSYPSFGTQALDAELAQAVKCGLSPAQLSRLAQVCPEQRLCVRLGSGARFVVTAQHAQHLIACITESCRDRIRDVMGAAQ